MIIDWFTVIAQAINFLVLVWLLKRFLYRPVLDAIDAREKLIALTLAEAEVKKDEAQQEKNDFQQRNDLFDQQRATLLSTATDDAKAAGQMLLTEARLAAEAYAVKRQEALQREKQSLNVEIGHRTREEVFAIARKILVDLADVDLEERMSEVFRRRLQELDDEKKEQLSKAFTTKPAPVSVRSAFMLPPVQQKKIQQALQETISTDINISFEIVPELISGIELTANGQKIAWSISEYLGSLERSITELLKEQVNLRPDFQGEAETEAEATPEYGTTTGASKEAK